jgi:hypothetical protein
MLRSASLRASLRRKEGAPSFITQHLRASVCATNAHTLAQRAGLLYFALPGWASSRQALRYPQWMGCYRSGIQELAADQRAMKTGKLKKPRGG